MSSSVTSSNPDDLSQSNSQEAQDLIQTLQEMFPTTCIEFLEEMSEELVGKPAALERFISEHLDRDSQPPDYWQPQIKIEQSASSSSSTNNQPIVDLSKPNSREIQDLFQSLSTMFPDTPAEFLGEKAEELIGKPDAINRFVSEHLDRTLQPPDNWQPQKIQNKMEPPNNALFHGIAQNTIKANDSEKNSNHNDNKANMTMDVTMNPKPGTSKQLMMPMTSPSVIEETEEDKVNKRLLTLENLFPKICPEFLYLRAKEFGDDSKKMNQWIEDTIESKSTNEFPSRADYEKKKENAELQEKYSAQVTVQEILDMYEDAEAYFMNPNRTASDLYKRHSLNQLKKDFRKVTSRTIDKIFKEHKGLLVPCSHALKKFYLETTNGRGIRKTPRPPSDWQVGPIRIDINFLKELQYLRKEKEIKEFIKNKEKQHEKKVQKAKKSGSLKECLCCYNDECLLEEMFPCSGGHLFCKECVQRASEVCICRN